MAVALLRKGAIISSCGIYRYTLLREWDPALGRVVWILLNPSKADAELDDPTLKKGVEFARRWGYGSLVYVNLFAFRATDPVVLRAAYGFGTDVVGPENDAYILEQVAMADLVMVGWGGKGKLGGRDAEVAKLLEGTSCFCLVQNKDGSPQHPLYVSYATARKPWRAA